jgi:hypothetical protein
MAAAMVLDTVRPDEAARMREQAEPLYQRALASAWLDRNRDGIVDPGESPALVGLRTSAQRMPTPGGESLGRTPIRWDE